MHGDPQVDKPLRVWRYGDTKCSVDGCGRKIRIRGLCGAHLERVSRGTGLQPDKPIKTPQIPKPPCIVAGCEREHQGRGYCAAHLSRVNRGSGPMPERPIHESPGRHVDLTGYVQVVTKPGHPGRARKTWMPEHRAVMEIHLGRVLRKGENVHHFNGVRGDNRIENLELWSTAQPAGQRVIDKIEWARALIAQYEGEEGTLAEMEARHGGTASIEEGTDAA